VEELPPNEFFFDKKRKAVMRQELYQEAGTVSKKFKILTDGRTMKKEEFATQIAGTLGAFAMSKPIFSRDPKRSAEVKKSSNQDIRG
jgi:hypothetical protein